MKEVRLNDKLWFGKYKNVRMSDIIKTDPTFIQKIIKEGKIKLDKKSIDLFESKYGPMNGSARKSGLYRPSFTRSGLNYNTDPVIGMMPPAAVSEQSSTSSVMTSSIVRENLQIGTRILGNRDSTYVKNIFRMVLSRIYAENDIDTRLLPIQIEDIVTVFYAKVRRREIISISGIYDYVFIIKNLESLKRGRLENDSITLKVTELIDEVSHYFSLV